MTFEWREQRFLRLICDPHGLIESTGIWDVKAEGMVLKMIWLGHSLQYLSESNT